MVLRASGSPLEWGSLALGFWPVKLFQTSSHSSTPLCQETTHCLQIISLWIFIYFLGFFFSFFLFAIWKMFAFFSPVAPCFHVALCFHYVDFLQCILAWGNHIFVAGEGGSVGQQHRPEPFSCLYLISSEGLTLTFSLEPQNIILVKCSHMLRTKKVLDMLYVFDFQILYFYCLSESFGFWKIGSVHFNTTEKDSFHEYASPKWLNTPGDSIIIHFWYLNFPALIQIC